MRPGAHTARQATHAQQLVATRLQDVHSAAAEAAARCCEQAAGSSSERAPAVQLFAVTTHQASAHAKKSQAHMHTAAVSRPLVQRNSVRVGALPDKLGQGVGGGGGVVHTVSSAARRAKDICFLCVLKCRPSNVQPQPCAAKGARLSGQRGGRSQRQLHTVCGVGTQAPVDAAVAAQQIPRATKNTNAQA
jgi:hypothetical protein